MKRKELGVFELDSSSLPDKFVRDDRLGEGFIWFMQSFICLRYDLHYRAIDILLKPEFDLNRRGKFRVVLLGKPFERRSKKYLRAPSIVGPLLRMKISDEEMRAMGKIFIHVMHEPIDDSHGCPRIFSLWTGGRGMGLVGTRPEDIWGDPSLHAFAYMVP